MRRAQRNPETHARCSRPKWPPEEDEDWDFTELGPYQARQGTARRAWYEKDSLERGRLDPEEKREADWAAFCESKDDDDDDDDGDGLDMPPRKSAAGRRAAASPRGGGAAASPRAGASPRSAASPRGAAGAGLPGTPRGAKKAAATAAKAAWSPAGKAKAPPGAGDGALIPPEIHTCS